MQRLGIAVLLCAFSQTAHAEPLADFFSSNAWGSRGGYHLQAARSVSPGALVIALADSYTSGSNVFALGDVDTQSTLALHLLWSPVDGMEVGVGESAVVNKYTNLVGTSLQLLGNPILFAKYTRPMAENLGLGGVFQLLLPTAQGGNGLVPGALGVSFEGIASYRVHPYVDLTANLGYVYDRANTLFSAPDSLERFVFGLFDAQHRARYGVGAVSEFTVADAATLSPFVEFWGQYTGTLALQQNPFAAAVGLKAFPSLSRIIQGMVGVDYRLAGEPHASVPAPGLPHWLLFVQLDFHMGESVLPPTAIMVPRCDSHDACGPEHVCENHACVRIQVVREPAQACEKTPTVALRGMVVDAESGLPVAGARVRINKSTNPITVNSDTGQFDVCPMPADGGMTKLSAQALGYLDEEVVSQRTPSDEPAAVVIKLRPTGSRITGVFRGNVRDSTTGLPVPGVSIYVPAATLKVTPQPDGNFDATLPVGRYQVLVSAPGYETQKKDVTIAIDQIVISNIDLVRRGKAKAEPSKGRK